MKSNLEARRKEWDNMKNVTAIYPNSKKKNGGDGAKHTWHRPGSNKR